MVMKIALSGAHGTGKTTLANYLRDNNLKILDVHTCDEAPRVIINRAHDEFFRRGNNSPFRQSLIFLYQIIEETNKVRECDILICDRTVVDHLAYSSVLFPDESTTIEYLVLYEAVHAWIQEYSLIFKVPIEFAAIDDGVRESDISFQREIDSTIDALYMKMGVKPIIITGSVAERATQVETQINIVTRS